MLLILTVLWLATAVVIYTSWQDFRNKILAGWMGLFGFSFSFFQHPFFAVVLAGFLVIVLLWVGNAYEHPKFSPRYKNLVVVLAGIVFIILGAYLLKFSWSLQQSVNFNYEAISEASSPRAPVPMWQAQIDGWQALIPATASTGVIYVTMGIVLFSLSRTRAVRNQRLAK